LDAGTTADLRFERPVRLKELTVRLTRTDGERSVSLGELELRVERRVERLLVEGPRVIGLGARVPLVTRPVLSTGATGKPLEAVRWHARPAGLLNVERDGTLRAA